MRLQEYYSIWVMQQVQGCTDIIEIDRGVAAYSQTAPWYRNVAKQGGIAH